MTEQPAVTNVYHLLCSGASPPLEALEAHINCKVHLCFCQTVEHEMHSKPSFQHDEAHAQA